VFHIEHLPDRVMNLKMGDKPQAKPKASEAPGFPWIFFVNSSSPEALL
jgi:hypothetical protein